MHINKHRGTPRRRLPAWRVALVALALLLAAAPALALNRKPVVSAPAPPPPLPVPARPPASISLAGNPGRDDRATKGYQVFHGQVIVATVRETAATIRALHCDNAYTF